MSLDMTIGAQAADAIADVDVAVKAGEGATEATRFWLQDLLMVTGTTFGVAVASAIGVLLFLR